MPLWIQLLIAGVVSIGVIAVGKAIVTGLAISPSISPPGATIRYIASVERGGTSPSLRVSRST
jgi:hypothetical protein